MSSVNKVILVGNVGKEPEMRYTPNGVAVADFSIACNSKFGEKETTEWVTITAWKKTAELCNQYLKKGRQVYVEGRLQTDSWEDKGVTKYRTKVVANTVLFLGGKAEPEDVPFD